MQPTTQPTIPVALYDLRGVGSPRVVLSCKTNSRNAVTAKAQAGYCPLRLKRTSCCHWEREIRGANGANRAPGTIRTSRMVHRPRLGGLIIVTIWHPKRERWGRFRGDSPCVVANPSPPSGWVEDLHLLAAEHARHTTKPLARRTLRVLCSSRHAAR